MMEAIATKEFRTIGNLAEKLICERLRDLGFLDDNFNPMVVRDRKK
jgi:hypothetical protein